MDLAFVKDGVYYLYMNGSLIRTSEFKVKDNVIGYVLKEYREGKPKLSSIPVHESSKVKEIVEAKLVDEIKNLNAYVFDAKDFLIIHFGSIDEVKKDNTYVFVNGKPVLKTNLPQLFDLMKGNYELVKYLLKEFPKYGEVVRRSIISLVGMNKCDEAITLYNSLEKKYPEESLAVAECYEKREEYLEALKIYSFFSEQKYRELEKRLRDKVNLLIDEFERTYNVKSLFEALSILPTYDAPAIKLGWHFIRKKNHKEAVKYFEEAVRRRRDFTNILSLANAYIQNQQFKEALDTIQEAEKIRRNSSTAYLKGIALEYLNAPMEAQKEFFFACREGLVDACGKIKVYELYTPQNEFDPNSWIGYVLYGYKVEKVIGSGGMGYVLLVEKGMRKFAMKIVKKEFRYDEMLYEIAKLQEISKGSKYIVRIFASFVDENFTDYYSSPPAIVMEYMEGGDLRQIITNNEYSTLRHSSRWPEIVSIMFSKIADAIIHVNKNGYVHCDIKPSNILLNGKLPKYGEQAVQALLEEKITPKISDLGSSVKVGTPVIHYTPYYAHPLQRFGGRAEYNFDVYSLTISLYVALTNNFPFPEWLEREIEEAVIDPSKRENVIKDFYNMDPRLDYVPSEFHDLILRGLRGEITIEGISRELKQITRTEYGYNIPLNYSEI